VVKSGQGETYVVLDRDLHSLNLVRAPVPAAVATPERLARFNNLVSAWIGLGSHANICQALYVRTIGGLPHIFLEHTGGVLLNQWLIDHPASSLQLLDMAIRIGAGMEHAHTCPWLGENGEQLSGVVHGRLSPACIVVSSDANAQVTDFGPALPAPWFMAPEQWQSPQAAGSAADIYAFGCLLYLLLCRRPPFALAQAWHGKPQEQQRQEWARLHLEQPPPDPRQARPKLDAELAGLMLQCLGKRPAARPASFSDLLHRLRRVFERLSGRAAYYPEPARARPLPELLNNRAVARAEQGQLQEAEALWQQALEADPGHLEASFNLALYQWSYRGVSDTDVLAWMQEVQRSKAATWLDELLIGRLCQVMGDHARALELLRAAPAPQPIPGLTRACAFAGCAVAAESDDPNLWREAAGLLSGAGAALQGDPAVLMASAMAFFRLGDAETAQRLHAGAATIRPDLPATLQQGAALLVPGLHLVKQHGGLVGRARSIAISSDGRLAMVRSDEERFFTLDLRSGAVVKKLRATPGQPLRCLALAPDGSIGLTVSGSEAVSIWNLEEGFSRDKLQLHSGFLNHLSISTDGRWVAAAGSDGKVCVWDLTSHRRVASFSTHTGFASCVAISEDGRTVVSGGGDGVVSCDDVEQGTCLRSLIGHGDEITAVTMSPDARLVLSGSKDCTARLWSPQQEDPLIELIGHAGPVSFVALSQDQQWALTGSTDQTLRLWDLQQGRVHLVTRVTGPITSGAVATNWSTVVVAHGSTITQLRLDVIPERRFSWAVAAGTIGTQMVQRAVPVTPLPAQPVAPSPEVRPFAAPVAAATPMPAATRPAATAAATPAPGAHPPGGLKESLTPRPAAASSSSRKPAKAPDRAAPSLRRWLIIILLIAAVPLGFYVNQKRKQLSLSFDKGELRQTRYQLEHGVSRVDQYPTYQCELDRFDEYLNSFVGGSQRQAGDASGCLAKLGNTQNIEVLLAAFQTHVDDLARGESRGGSFKLTGSILIFLDDATIPAQVKAMDDASPEFCNVLASSLAARRSAVAAHALLERAHDPRPEIRRAISGRFAVIACSEVLSPEEALDLATRWAGDIDAEVRTNVAREIRVLGGSKPRALLKQLAADPEQKVRSEAERTLRNKG
jgi:tetratricopeptide (TPR) repeat protein